MKLFIALELLLTYASAHYIGRNLQLFQSVPSLDCRSCQAKSLQAKYCFNLATRAEICCSSNDTVSADCQEATNSNLMCSPIV